MGSMHSKSIKKGALVILVSILSVLLFNIAAAQEITGVDVTEKDALNAILQAEEDVQEMADSGLTILRANSTLKEAKEAFAGENYSKLLAETEGINDSGKREQAKKLIEAAQKALGEKKGDYPLVIRKADEIRGLKNRAYEVDDLVKALEIRINELEGTLDLEDARLHLSEAKKEFAGEAYDEAEIHANEGFGIVDRKAAEATELRLLYMAGRENIEYFFREHWKKVLIGCIIALIAGTIIHMQLSLILTRKRLVNLRLEKRVLLDLMEKAQHDRFKLGMITNKEYEIKMSKFKERLMEVEKDIPVVESKLHLGGKSRPKTKPNEKEEIKKGPYKKAAK